MESGPHPSASRRDESLEQGAEPRGCAELTAAARMVKENATVWVGDRNHPSAAQGMRMLGSPIGHPDFVRSFLDKKTAEHSVLLERIPAVSDFAISMVAVVVLRCTQIQFLPSHSAATIGRGFCDSP